MSTLKLPLKEPTLRMKTQPNDANAMGDIFGGWLMSQIDIAAGIAAAEASKGLVATVAVKELTFLQPLYVYDLVSFYTEVIRIGNSSITIFVETYATRWNNLEDEIIDKISDATLVFAAIESPGKKRMIQKYTHSKGGDGPNYSNV